MEVVPYLHEALLVQAAGELLRMPHRAIGSALVFLHKGRAALRELAPETKEALTDPPGSERMAAACLFLASKVEEASVRTNDLLNTVRHLAQNSAAPDVLAAFPALATASAQPVAPLPPQPPASDAAAPLQQQQQQAPGRQMPGGAGPGAAAALGSIVSKDLLVGDEYYARKEVLISDEQLLLRLLRFEVAIEPPHKYLLNFCATLGVPCQVARLAVCLVNDAALLTDACMAHPPEELAGGALHLAMQLTGSADSLPGGGPAACWRALGLPSGSAERAAESLLAVLLHAERMGQGGGGPSRGRVV